MDFLVIEHWRQVDTLAQNLCTPNDKHGLMAQSGVEVQPAHNAFLPIIQLENRFLNLSYDTYLTFLPHPSCEKLRKLLKLCTSLVSSVK